MEIYLLPYKYASQSQNWQHKLIWPQNVPPPEQRHFIWSILLLINVKKVEAV